MTDKLRVGLIGCGNVVSYGHKPALLGLDDVELVALADITPARRDVGKQWFGLDDRDLYEDYNNVLARDDVDAVCITVPQGYRRRIVLDSVGAGKHVLSEKPIAATPAVAAELVHAAENAGVTFGMVHNYHFLPDYRALKELIDAGTVGDVRVLTLNYLGVIDKPGASEYDSNWRHTMAAGGGVLMDMIHAVYLSEWLMGAAAQQINAFVDAPRYADRNPVVEDLALLQVAFPSGYALINMGWGQGTGGVDVSGGDGQIHLRYEDYHTSGFNRPAELYSVQDWQRTDHELDNLETHGDNIARSFTRLWTDFRDAIREGRDPIAPARAGQRALELALGGYLAAVTGRTVTLPLADNHPVYRDGIDGMTRVDIWEASKAKAAGLFGLRGR